MHAATLLALLAVALALPGCVTGPVTDGPVTTAQLQALGQSEGAKLLDIATRNIAARYDALLAQAHRIYQRGEAQLLARRPSGDLTPAQAQTWAAEVARQMVRLAEERDEKLTTLSRKRTAELEQAAALQRNAVQATAGIVAGWAAQGRLHKEQIGAFLAVAREGVVYFREQRDIKALRQEAKEAAERAEREAAEAKEE